MKEGKPTTDQWKLNGRRKVRNLAFIDYVTTDIEKYQRVMFRRLALARGVSKNTIHSTLPRI